MEGGESKCLVRATNGKTKISTIVNSKDVNRFQQVLFNFTNFTLAIDS